MSTEGQRQAREIVTKCNLFAAPPKRSNLAVPWGLGGRGSCVVCRLIDHDVHLASRIGRLAFRVKGDAVTILAIWFGVALVVGLLLGYAARRLKGVPKGQQHIRKVGDANAEDSGDQHKLASSRRSPMRTNKLHRRLWRI